MPGLFLNVTDFLYAKGHEVDRVEVSYWAQGNEINWKYVFSNQGNYVGESETIIHEVSTFTEFLEREVEDLSLSGLEYVIDTESINSK